MCICFWGLVRSQLIKNVNKSFLANAELIVFRSVHPNLRYTSNVTRDEVKKDETELPPELDAKPNEEVEKLCKEVSDLNKKNEELLVRTVNRCRRTKCTKVRKLTGQIQKGTGRWGESPNASHEANIRGKNIWNSEFLQGLAGRRGRAGQSDGKCSRRGDQREEPAPEGTVRGSADDRDPVADGV